MKKYVNDFDQFVTESIVTEDERGPNLLDRWHHMGMEFELYNNNTVEVNWDSGTLHDWDSDIYDGKTGYHQAVKDIKMVADGNNEVLTGDIEFGMEEKGLKMGETIKYGETKNGEPYLIVSVSSELKK